MIRRPSVRHPSTIFKDLLRNCLTNQSQILCGAPWEGGKKVCLNGPSHMTKIAATPTCICGTNLSENILIQSRKSGDDLETWHAASRNQALQSLYKWLTLTYFTTGSNLVTCAFEWEKMLQSN